MSGSYIIDVDPARSLVRIRISGFLDHATVTKFAAERIRSMKKLRCGPNQHVTLCDVTAQMISSPDVAEALKQMIADPRYSAKRIAFVVDNALARMQTQRVTQRDHVGYFRDAASAEAWLLEDSAATA